MAFDFGIFYSAAQCWTHGQSPYTCAHFFYPLPTLFVFLPFTAFSYPVARVLWWAALLVAFVVTLKRRALWFMLYVPALQAFYLGQIDLLLLPAVALGNGPALALLTLKPQLVWLYLPLWFLSAPRRERLCFLAVSGALWAASFVAYPHWPVEFLATTRRLSQAAYASPSLWGGAFLPWWLVIPAGLVLLGLARGRWAASMAANPAIISYDLAILAPRARWWLVPLSWLTQYASNAMGMAAPHVLLSLAAAWWSLRIPHDAIEAGATIATIGQIIRCRAGHIHISRIR